MRRITVRSWRTAVNTQWSQTSVSGRFFRLWQTYIAIEDHPHRRTHMPWGSDRPYTEFYAWHYSSREVIQP